MKSKAGFASTVLDLVEEDELSIGIDKVIESFVQSSVFAADQGHWVSLKENFF